MTNDPPRVVAHPLNEWLRALMVDTLLPRELELQHLRNADAIRRWLAGSEKENSLTKREFYRIYMIQWSAAYDITDFYANLVLIEALVTESEQKRSGLKYPLIETRKGMILMTPMSWWRNFFYGE